MPPKPVFIHIFETDRECLHELVKLSEFFQYYPDTQIKQQALEIRTPVMDHLFRTKSRVLWRGVAGLHLVGYTANCCLPESMEAHLKAYTKPAPWAKKG